MTTHTHICLFQIDSNLKLNNCKNSTFLLPHFNSVVLMFLRSYFISFYFAYPLIIVVILNFTTFVFQPS